MAPSADPKDAEIARLNRRLARERQARLDAESIGEMSLRRHYDRAQEMGLIQTIAAAANEAKRIEHVLQITVDEVCRYTGWPVGTAWLVAADGSGELFPSGIWHLEPPERFRPFREVSEARRFAPGIGLPGRVSASGKPEWIVDVTRDSNFPRADAAVETGIRAGFGFPILVEAEVVGVLEFFSAGAAEPDETLLQTMGLIGIQLGRVVERARTDRMRQDFVAMLVHDIKTPLAAVLGFTELLRDDIAADSEAREMLDRIEANAHHAITLTVNLLDVQRIESGRLEIRRDPTSLNDVVRHALRHQASRIRLSNLTVDLQLDETLPEIQADLRLIDRVVANLLSNAIKFSPPTGRIRLATLGTGNGVWLSVRDEGPGVSAENRARLFKRFASAGGSRADSSGLGLFIVKTIVTAHDGEVGFEFPPTGGSEFFVTLPVKALAPF